MLTRKGKEKISSIEFMSKKSLNQISNFSSFLQSVTPIAPLKPLSEKEAIENFKLGELWDSFEEWSAYGVGVPLTLNNHNVTQYYAPYLSAIQIYTVQSPTTLSSCKIIPKNNNSETSNLSNFNTETMEYSKNQLGYLYLEYSDVCAYTWRHPLIDKVAQIYSQNPGIVKLNSVDLSPASWMAITWSPIGYIPLLGLRKRVPTYFITYHTLSSLFQENTNDETKEGVSMLRKKNSGIPLPPFGIASYKMQNDVYMDKAQAITKYDDLHGAANCWLNQLNYYHHDFRVFTSNAKNLDYIYLF